ncbi:MAG: alpha/beta hydrolase [Labilithrix sp.]|nr:alpha/beta hydrolase [Labilithrix sp.]
MRVARRITISALVVLASAGCRSSGPAARRTLALRPCHLAHVPVETLCGEHEVFEDRGRLAGRKIKLNVAVVPALAPRPAPDPVFILAGGPGQAATATAPALVAAFERVRRDRDLVFVDQRGTGRSNPLRCPLEDDPPLAERLGAQPSDETIAKCLASYDADPRLYTTSIAMDDLDDVRAALGYEKINLWGGSYGTRAALVYVRRHEEHVRTVTLDGVAPFTLKLPLSVAQDGHRALDALFADCAADRACNEAFPDLRARFDALITSLRARPAETHVPHPVTGESTKVSIHASHFAGIVRGLLYFPEIAAQLPLTIDRATRGDYGPFVAHAWLLGTAVDASAGLFLSVVCAEDVPFTTTEEIDAATRDTFLGSDFVRETMHTCSLWPRGEVPSGYRDPIRSNVATLILSGELDPVTPPRYGDDAKAHLSSAEHRVVTGVGHGATRPGCVADLFADFLAAGSARGLDPPCLRENRRPPFTVSFAGPKP